MITDRSEVTSMILAAKVQKNISWTGVATAIGQSKEWTTAGCLGQMAFNKAQAEKIGTIFGLSDEAVAWLQIARHKGSLPTAVPADPLIYRWYEIVAVYGTTIKELIHEEFGDGIMSAIDFSMDISREADPKGDRVKVVMSGQVSALQNLLRITAKGQRLTHGLRVAADHNKIGARGGIGCLASLLPITQSAERDMKGRRKFLLRQTERAADDFDLRHAFHSLEIIGRKRPRVRIAQGSSMALFAAHCVEPGPIVARRLSRCLRGIAVAHLVRLLAPK